MSKLPQTVDPWLLAKSAKVESREVQLADFERLQSLLLDTPDKIACAQVEWHIESSLDHQLRLYLRIEAQLPLICQRCLQSMTASVSVDRVFRLVRAITETLVVEEEDRLELDDDQLKLADVVEDELILAIPLVPKHADLDDCNIQLQAEFDNEAIRRESQTENPFAALKDLKLK